MQKNKEIEAELFWQRMDQLMGKEEPYAWASRNGLNKPTFQSARDRKSKPLSKTLQGWAVQLGLNFDWLNEGIGEPYTDEDPYAAQNREKLDRMAHERAMEAQRGVQSTVMAYPKPSPDPVVLQLAISTLFEALEATKKRMPPDKMTIMIMRLYEMYSAQQGDNIKNYVLDLIRSLGVSTETQS